MSGDKTLGGNVNHLGLAELLKQAQKSGGDTKPSLHAQQSKTTNEAQDASTSIYKQLGVEQIRLNPYQPREYFDAKALDELAQSIKQHGILQPLVVRRIPDQADCYELVAGQRRLEAAKLVGQQTVPACVHEMDDVASMTVAMLENIQREDLNVIELAHGYAKIMEHLGCTHQVLADMLGKSRSAVSNSLRLLQLAPEVKEMLAKGQLDMGHARCLLACEQGQQVILAKKIVAEGLSVRAVESFMQQPGDVKAGGKKRQQAAASPAVTQAQQACAQAFPMAKVRVKASGKGAVVTLACKDQDQLAALLARLPT
jgi:ParB family transcriptional regulator, chromosome partitioning protein